MHWFSHFLVVVYGVTYFAKSKIASLRLHVNPRIKNVGRCRYHEDTCFIQRNLQLKP